MADKLQLKTKFNSLSGSTTKTITMGKTTATDDNMRKFSAAIGSMVSAYTLVSNSKVETTSLDNN